MKKLPRTKRATKFLQPQSSFELDVLGVRDPLGSDWRPVTPSKYDPKFCEMIIIHCHNGGTFEEFASAIGVCVDTIQEWGDRHHEFSVAKARAKQEALNFMVKLGRKSLLGQRIGPEGKSRAINWPLWIFFMKARFGWREENAESDDGDVEFDFE